MTTNDPVTYSGTPGSRRAIPPRFRVGIFPVWLILWTCVSGRVVRSDDDLSLDKELSKPAPAETVKPADAVKPEVGKPEVGKPEVGKPEVEKQTGDDEAGLGEGLSPDPKEGPGTDGDVDLERFLEDGAAKGDKLMEQLNKAIGTMSRARRALSEEGANPKDRTAQARQAQTDAVADLDELIRLMEEEMNQPPPDGGGGGGGGGAEGGGGGGADDQQAGEQGQAGGAKSRGMKRKSLAGMGQGGQGRSIARGGSRGQSPSRKPGQPQQKGGRPGGQQTAGRDNSQPGDSEEGVRKNEGGGPAEDPKERLAKDVWGHLPPQLREQLLNVYTEKYLPKYEQLVRDYYEALAEQQRSRPIDR